jgi:Phosphoesterase family
MMYFKFTILFAAILIIFCMRTAGDIVKGEYFDRFFLIMFENTNYTEALNHPYLSNLTNRQDGILLSNFFAVDHPSEPNYIAQIYGSTLGILDDNDYNVTGRNLVDLLEDKGISWKAYMENYPGNCYQYSFGLGNGSYARKHNPFISMVDIYSDPVRCAKIVNASQLDTDISENSVPQFAYYTPNQQNDAHDTNLTFAMTWFESWFEPKLQNQIFTTNTLFFITFEEAEPYIIPNHIFGGLLGSPVSPNANHSDNTYYSHFSVAKTIEDNWGLPSMGRNDTTATPFTKFLNGKS